MANHGKQGADLEAHLRRRRRPHVVSGVYVSDSSAKPVAMTRREFGRRLRHRGGGKGGKIIHYHGYRCEGR